MAEGDDVGFTFGDFTFAPPPQPLLSNGVSSSSTSTSQNDDVWGSFFSSSLPPQSSPSQTHQFKPSSNSGNEPAQSRPNQSPVRADPGHGKLPKPQGPLPLSLFGEVEDEVEQETDNCDQYVDNNSSALFDSNPAAPNRKLGDNQQINSQNGSGFNFDNNDDQDDDDDWEFKGAFSENGVVKQNWQQQGASGVAGLKMAMPFEKQAGQDASNSVEHKPGFSSFFPPSYDLYATSHGTVNKCTETDVGFKSTTVWTNAFMLDALPGVQEIGTGSGISATAADPVEPKPSFSNSFPQSNDLFAASHGAVSVNTARDTDVGHNSTTVMTNGFMFDASPGVREVCTGGGISASAANSVELKPLFSSSSPQSNDLFAASHGARSSGMNVGVGQTTVMTNVFNFDAFPGVEEIGNGNATSVTTMSVNEDDEFDDFGDFIDASQAIGSKEQLEQAVPHVSPAKAQDKQTQPGTSRGALPLSLFSDGMEESSDGLNHAEELVDKATSNSGRSFSGQGSVIPIHDLVSNLYSQAQSTPSVNRNGGPSENGGTYPEENMDTHSLSGDDDWEDNTWEFKNAFSEAGVIEQASSANTGSTGQKQFDTSSNLQVFINFYAKLKGSLCFLISCQLDELKKARSLDTAICYGEKAEALGSDIAEAHKLLEESMTSQEILSKKHLERSSCLNEVFEILQGPKFIVIESEYSLSKKLQLAANDWRVATDLLIYATSVLKILSMGSADEQSLYASTWSKITDICAQELRYGSLIWKRAAEKKVQHQVLSHCRGQQYILALGEIYKVVELLGLSAKVYKPWMLLSVSNSSQFFSLFDECGAIWSSSGLEEALLNMSDNVDLGCNGTAKQLITSIKNICDFDVLTLLDCIFVQHKPICWLSLLPQEILPDLKIVLWNGELYFLNLANLWANRISYDPPQLPHFSVS